MNNTVKPIFNEKLIKNEIYEFINSTSVYCLQKTDQMLRLLFIYST